MWAVNGFLSVHYLCLVTQNMAGNWCAIRSDHIAINTRSEPPTLSKSKEYYQKSILVCCTAFKKAFITLLSGAAFGELAHGAAVLKLKQMLRERLASLDIRGKDGF